MKKYQSPGFVLGLFIALFLSMSLAQAFDYGEYGSCWYSGGHFRWAITRSSWNDEKYDAIKTSKGFLGIIPAVALQGGPSFIYMPTFAVPYYTSQRGIAIAKFSHGNNTFVSADLLKYHNTHIGDIGYPKDPLSGYEIKRGLFVTDEDAVTANASIAVQNVQEEVLARRSRSEREGFGPKIPFLMTEYQKFGDKQTAQYYMMYCNISTLPEYKGPNGQPDAEDIKTAVEQFKDVKRGKNKPVIKPPVTSSAQTAGSGGSAAVSGDSSGSSSSAGSGTSTTPAGETKDPLSQ